MDREVIVVEGIRMHVEESGSGPPLLLIHGLGGPLIWQRIIGPLSVDFRVIIPHLPGFGESDSPASPLSAGGYARILHKALDELEIRSAALAGTSYGGEIAVRCAEIDPGRVGRLVLINSTGFRERGGIPAALLGWSPVRLVLAQLLRSRWFVCRVGALSFHDTGRRPAALCTEVFRQLLRPGHREACVEGLRAVLSNSAAAEVMPRRIPALVIWGEFDRLARHNSPRSLDLTGSSTIIIPRAGHSLPLEAPEELCSALRAFAGTSAGNAADHPSTSS